MKNKLLFCLVAAMFLPCVCDARISHHHRNDGVTFLGGEKSSLQYKKYQTAYDIDVMDIDGSSRAACMELPRYIETNKSYLLGTEGKTPAKIVADESKFYDMVLAHVRHGGDYGFKASGYDFSKPEEEYFLSHKIDALKLITHTQTKNIKPETRAEAIFRLAQIMEKKIPIITNKEIFDLYHTVSISIPDTEFGAQAVIAQLGMLYNQQVDVKELAIADLSRLMNVIQIYSSSPLWRKAGFTTKNQINEKEKKAILRARSAEVMKEIIERNKYLRKDTSQGLRVEAGKYNKLSRQNAQENLLGLVH